MQNVTDFPPQCLQNTDFAFLFAAEPARLVVNDNEKGKDGDDEECQKDTAFVIKNVLITDFQILFRDDSGIGIDFTDFSGNGRNLLRIGDTDDDIGRHRIVHAENVTDQTDLHDDDVVALQHRRRFEHSGDRHLLQIAVGFDEIEVIGEKMTFQRFGDSRPHDHRILFHQSVGIGFRDDIERFFIGCSEGFDPHDTEIDARFCEIVVAPDSRHRIGHPEHSGNRFASGGFDIGLLAGHDTLHRNIGKRIEGHEHFRLQRMRNRKNGSENEDHQSENREYEEVFASPPCQRAECECEEIFHWMTIFDGFMTSVSEGA